MMTESQKNNIFFSQLSQELKDFEEFLKKYVEKHFSSKINNQTGLKDLIDSIHYSLFSLGKRFRPALVIATCKTIGVPISKCFPLAAALEMIHTASLIHDDLPSIDNDEIRRGKPSNHMVFKEDIALLAGDSLFIEPFYLLTHYQQNLELIHQVAQASSLRGMIGGQALDLRFKPSNLMKVYEMKTGVLIQTCVTGCLTLTSHSDEKNLTSYGYYLGQSFQLADDIEDFDSQEKSNASQVMSREEALQQLKKWTQKGLDAIKNIKAPLLEDILLFNQNRVSEFSHEKR